MKSLTEIRGEIDALDSELVRLLRRRLEIADEVADAKRAAGLAVTDATREQAVLDQVAAAAGENFAEDVRNFYRGFFAASKARQRRRLCTLDGARPLRVAVVGLGLIGGSFFKAARLAGHTVTGLHHGESDGLSVADLVLVCLPPEAIVPWIKANARHFCRGALVVDICGVKAPIAAAMREVVRDGWHFVGGHPMAGREVSGFANSKADLFTGASMILTPEASLPEFALVTLRNFFRSVGFHRTVLTTPENHDSMIAFTSQLCHVVATAYARDPRAPEAVGYSAGSYANMTRVATQDAAVWSALYLENRAALLDSLDGLITRLGEFRDALSAADLPRIKKLIDEGTAAKNEELLARERGDEA